VYPPRTATRPGYTARCVTIKPSKSCSRPARHLTGPGSPQPDRHDAANGSRKQAPELGPRRSGEGPLGSRRLGHRAGTGLSGAVAGFGRGWVCRGLSGGCAGDRGLRASARRRLGFGGEELSREAAPSQIRLHPEALQSAAVTPGASAHTGYDRASVAHEDRQIDFVTESHGDGRLMTDLRFEDVDVARIRMVLEIDG
jgi:hypothetical protein